MREGWRFLLRRGVKLLRVHSRISHAFSSGRAVRGLKRLVRDITETQSRKIATDGLARLSTEWTTCAGSLLKYFRLVSRMFDFKGSRWVRPAESRYGESSPLHGTSVDTHCCLRSGQPELAQYAVLGQPAPHVFRSPEGTTSRYSTTTDQGSPSGNSAGVHCSSTAHGVHSIDGE